MTRASRALRHAPVSPCLHCGRETKTVSGGVCAECWRAKEPGAREVFRSEPRTWPLFDWSFDWLGINPFGSAALAIALVGAVVVALIKALG